VEGSIFEDPSSLFLSNSGFHLFHLFPDPLYHRYHLYSQLLSTPAIESLNYVCRRRKKGGKLSKITQEPEGFLEEKWRKGGKKRMEDKAAKTSPISVL
jgi:hypothetical protein